MRGGETERATRRDPAEGRKGRGKQTGGRKEGMKRNVKNIVAWKGEVPQKGRREGENKQEGGRK